MRPLEVISTRPLTAAACFGFIVSLVAAIPITRTIIHPDEVGFILNANHLLGGGPSRLPYFPGYSGFLVPVLATTTNPDVIVRGVQLINGLLAAGTAAMSVAVLQRLRPDARSVWHVLAACAASLYPAFRLFGSLALSENALIPAGLGLLLLTLRAGDDPSLRRLLVANAAAGASLLLHPRAIGIAAGTVLAILFVATTVRHRLAGVFTALAAGSAALAAARLVLESDGQFGVGQSDRTSFGGLIAETLEPRSLVTLPIASLGQLLYLSVATLGLASLGALGITRILRTWPNRMRSERFIALWIVPCSLFTLAVSSMFMNQGTGDKAIYGRYVEAVLLPLLLVGLAMLTTALTNAEQRVVIAFPSIGAMVLIALRGTDAFEGRQQLLNVSGIVPIIEFSDRIDPAAMALAGTIAVVLVLLSRRLDLGAVALVGLAFLAVSTTVQLRFGDVADALEATQESDLVDVVEGLGDQPLADSCVLLDETDLIDPWAQQNFRLENLEIDFLPFRQEQPAPRCAESVLTSRGDFTLVRPGSILLAVDPITRQSIWVLPTDRQSEYFSPDRPGVSDPSALVEGESPAELEFSVPEQSTQVQSTHPQPDSDGEDVIEVVVQLTNQSSTAFVPPFGPIGLPGPVAVGVEWRDPADPSERIAEPYRIQLDRILYPGQTVTLTADIPLAIDNEPLANGTWLLRTELVQEGVRWIDMSSDVVSVEVDSES